MEHHKISYVEFPATDAAAVKSFYGQAFGWGFVDYGPTYAALEKAGLDGGFQADVGDPSRPAAPLVVLFSTDLDGSLARVRAAGGEITRDIFSFPGGRRFHFRDPAGNELGVFSES